MTHTDYLMVLGWLLLIHARQLRNGPWWDTALAVVLTTIACCTFIYMLVTTA